MEATPQTSIDTDAGLSKLRHLSIDIGTFKKITEAKLDVILDRLLVLDKINVSFQEFITKERTENLSDEEYIKWYLVRTCTITTLNYVEEFPKSKSIML